MAETSEDESAGAVGPSVTSWHHLAIPVSNLGESVLWYTAVLGAVVIRRTDDEFERSRGRIPQAWMDVAGFTVNLAEHVGVPRDPDRHFLHAALRSDGSVEQWLATLQGRSSALGPYGHGGLSFLSLYFDDPDGFRWEVVIDFADEEAAMAELERYGGEVGSPAGVYK